MKLYLLHEKVIVNQFWLISEMLYSPTVLSIKATKYSETSGFFSFEAAKPFQSQTKSVMKKTKTFIQQSVSLNDTDNTHNDVFIEKRTPQYDNFFFSVIYH